MSRIVASAICCLALAAGCRSTPPASPPVWPKLDTEIKPDTNVLPPPWYKPLPEPAAWPLPEPEYATKEWREWVVLKYTSRGVIRRVSQPPTVDGKLDDPTWKGAELEIPFADLAGEPVSPGTTVHATYDQSDLHIAIRAAEPSPDKMKTASGPAAAVSASDHVMVELVPDWKAATPLQYMFAVTPAGTVFDSLAGATEWSSNLKAAAVIGKDSWTAEFAIPLAAFSVKPEELPGQIWAVRIVRFRYAGDAPQISSWTRIVDLERGRINLGYVLFEKPPEAKPPAEKRAEAPPAEAKPPAAEAPAPAPPKKPDDEIPRKDPAESEPNQNGN